MSDETLISYAPNREDVVLWRALGHVGDARYVDVGAWDPVEQSTTKALYDRGWRGINIDAVPEQADRLREARPEDEVVHAAVTDRHAREVLFHHVPGTGLSTLLDDVAEQHGRAGWETRDITVPARRLDEICAASGVLTGELHLLKVDVEGAEAEVLRSLDLLTWRPWVVLVKATRPLSTRPSHDEWHEQLDAAGWTVSLFDGVSRYYVSPDHPELAAPLGYPACALDDFVPAREHLLAVRADALTEENGRAHDEVIRWRREAVAHWANAVADIQRNQDDTRRARAEAARSRKQLAQVRENLQRVRSDRKRLKARVERMASRISRLEEQAHPVSGGTRARAVLRRARRTVARR